MADVKTRQEMFGEYLREASVLILVFGALDPLFHEPEVPASLSSFAGVLADSHGKIHAGLWYGAVFFGSMALLALGMRLERRR